MGKGPSEWSSRHTSINSITSPWFFFSLPPCPLCFDSVPLIMKFRHSDQLCVLCHSPLHYWLQSLHGEYSVCLTWARLFCKAWGPTLFLTSPASLRVQNRFLCVSLTSASSGILQNPGQASYITATFSRKEVFYLDEPHIQLGIKAYFQHLTFLRGAIQNNAFQQSQRYS